MTRDEAITRLRSLEPELRRQGMLSLFLFGSTARNEAASDSDIDLFCDLDPATQLGFAFFDIADRISAAIGRRVDLTTRNGLHPLIRNDVASQAVRVF